MLPIVTMFLTTGVLIFLLDFRGDYDRISYPVELSKPLSQDKDELEKVMRQKMAQLNIEMFKGWSRIKELDSAPSFEFEWHEGIDRVIKLEPTETPLIATLTVKNATLYRKFVMLHSAKGNKYFKLYASVFAAILFSMLITGYILAWRIKQHRVLLISSSIASLSLFTLLIFIQ